MGRGRGELVFLLSASKLVSDGLLMKRGEPLVTVLSPILTLMIQAHPNCPASLLLQAHSQTDWRGQKASQNTGETERCYVSYHLQHVFALQNQG